MAGTTYVNTPLMVWEFKDLQGTSMSIDCRGKYAALAGKRYVTLVNLKNTKDAAIKVPRSHKADTSVCAWNPHRDKSHLLTVTNTSKVEVLEYKGGKDLVQVTQLKSHSRAVNDVDWYPFESHIIASCSTDCCTCLWDLRESRKPVLTFQSVSAVSQVKWNKSEANIFATAHDSDVRIWDKRKTSQAMKLISCGGRVHDVEWCPYQNEHSEHHQLITAGEEKCFKVWDTQNPRKPQHVIPTIAPVGRAKYMPTGQAVLVALRADHESLVLRSLDGDGGGGRKEVVNGDTNMVLDLAWRTPAGTPNQQLVTWCHDQKLRLWDMKPYIQKKQEKAPAGAVCPLMHSCDGANVHL